MFLTQTKTLAVDAFRELNAKKLFWISILISILVVSVFLFVGINERGVSIFGRTIEAFINTSIVPVDDFYMFIFANIAIPWWLGLGAIILALVSVCGAFPDFLAGGSVDLFLARPVSRVRLFFTKYILGLLFVGLQVLVFTTAAFVVIGVRSGTWEWKLFWAVPIVTLMFSYLYCFCVLIGVITRSALAALLLTCVFWLFLFGLNSTDSIMTFMYAGSAQRIENQQQLITRFERVRDLASTEQATTQAISNIQRRTDRLDEFKAEADRWRFWYRVQYSLRASLPKTDETLNLVGRWVVDRTLFDAAEDQVIENRNARWNRPNERIRTDRQGDAAFPDDDQPEMRERVRALRANRSLWWVIGTSLGFQLALLLLAAVIFARKDF
jgi:ABC-type transport system involved in multi-copper enzyme maturation permease subunit